MSELAEPKSYYKQGYERGFNLPVLPPQSEVDSLREFVKDLPDVQSTAEYLLGVRDGKIEAWLNSSAVKINMWANNHTALQLSALFEHLTNVLKSHGVI